jgi:hypothetical protein
MMHTSGEDSAMRLKLIHLSVVGNDKPAAVIDFGERLTIIHGASDTGKSHIFDLIHYSLGLSKEIEVPPEGAGYQYVHLGIQTEDEGIITLVRDLTGGRIGLYQGAHREFLRDPAPEYLLPNHTSKNPRSVSRYLLGRMSLDNQFVRRNQNNITRMLELRDVLRLAAVGEADILLKRSPIESGQHADRPVESAIFRMFIEGQDDSGLVAIPKADELKAASANKVEILDQVIAKFETELEDVPSLDQLLDQLAKLNTTIVAISTSVEGTSAKRDRHVRQRSELTIRVARIRERCTEITTLEARFGLLLVQYDSDLERLDLLSQATDVLSPVGSDACPFCGAGREHQHWDIAESADNSFFVAAVTAEEAKIRSLRVDLLKTIEALREEIIEIRQEESSAAGQIAEFTTKILRWDDRVKEPGTQLSSALSVRSRLEREIEAHRRLLDLLMLRSVVATVVKPKTSTEVPIAATDLHRFDRIASSVLAEWAFSDDSIVSYSISERDLIVDQRKRSSRGKGVRSILHALFNVALAEYCLQRDFRHPGFVILDSPIVTYRQSDEPNASGEDETITTNVVDAFYAYLQQQFSGQSLVLENKSPLSPLPDGTKEYFFGGEYSDHGRRGFYPDPETS